MNWEEILELTRQGFCGLTWADGLTDGVCQAVADNACPKFKLYHRRDGAATVHFEYGVIGCRDRVAAIFGYLQDRPNIVPEGIATDAIAVVNGIRFRIGIGGTLQYIVFKPMEPISYRLAPLQEKTLEIEFGNFQKAVSDSGLDILLSGIK